MPDSAEPFRVGIIGGMGPLAGIELHRLILEATPAERDQDHLQVVLFTNPNIPDRTTSLRENGGAAFATAVGQSAKLLEQAGVDSIVIACMTAHSRIETIQSFTNIPVMNGISLVHKELKTQYHGKKIALLATSGSVRSGVYTSRTSDIDWLLPTAGQQESIDEAIYTIKAGSVKAGRNTLLSVIEELANEGADTFTLGCTELGLLHDDLEQQEYSVVDPLRLMARRVVALAGFRDEMVASIPNQHVLQQAMAR